MIPAAHPIEPADPPFGTPASTGHVELLLTCVLFLAIVSYPLWTLTALLAGILVIHAAQRAVSALVRRIDGDTHAVRIPRVGTIDYRFTTK